MEMIARLALISNILVLDGGNRFDGYHLARALRKHTTDVDCMLRKILLSRAFTCYQLLAMLNEFPPGNTPVIVLDILSTFLDENIKLQTRQELLEAALKHLQKLSLRAPVVIWAKQRSIVGVDDKAMLNLAIDAAGRTWKLENVQPDAYQPSLL